MTVPADAARRFDSCGGMGLWAAATRRRLGEHRADDEDRGLITAADARMTAQGILNTARMARSGTG